MAFSELERRRVHKLLTGMFARRVPPHLADEIRLRYVLRGRTVTVHEARSVFWNPEQWAELKVAQFRQAEDGLWTLHWPDRRGRWHRLPEVAAVRDLGRLVATLEADAGGVFWP